MKLTCSSLIYDCTTINTEALQFTNSLNSFCGRGSDIADANFSSLSAEPAADSFHPYYHLCQSINRSKTQTVQAKHAAYPQRESKNFMFCYVWGLCYLFVLCKEQIGQSGKLFQHFSALFRNKDNSQIESRVSPFYNKLLDAVWQSMSKRYKDSPDAGWYNSLRVSISHLLTFVIFQTSQIMSRRVLLSLPNLVRRELFLDLQKRPTQSKGEVCNN